MTSCCPSYILHRHNLHYGVSAVIPRWYSLCLFIIIFESRGLTRKLNANDKGSLRRWDSASFSQVDREPYCLRYICIYAGRGSVEANAIERKQIWIYLVDYIFIVVGCTHRPPRSIDWRISVHCFGIQSLVDYWKKWKKKSCSNLTDGLGKNGSS